MFNASTSPTTARPPNRELTKEVVVRLRIKVENASSDEWRCHCPFHSDRTPSMYINPDKFIYHCFQCGSSGSLYQLYKRITGGNLLKDIGVASDSFSSFAYQSTYVEEDYTKLNPSILVNVTRGTPTEVENEPLAMRYLRKRGIPLSIAKQMQMKFLSLGEINGTHFANRLLIPIYEEGRCISMEGRDVTGQQDRKVLYPKNSTVSTLYDIDNLKKNKTLFVVEGLMDLAVLRTDSFFENSTAVFGAGISRRQLYLLNQFEDIIIIPDADEAGKKSLHRLRDGLKKPFKIMDVPNLGIKDVGDIPQKLRIPVESLRKRGWGRVLRSSTSLIFFTN